MATTASPRTVRFTPDELQEIEAFLKQNQFLDFSKLARLAISAFIRKPELKIRPVNKKDVGPASQRKQLSKA